MTEVNSIPSFIVNFSQGLVQTVGTEAAELAQGVLRAGGEAEVVLRSTFDAVVGGLEARVADLTAVLNKAKEHLDKIEQAVENFLKVAAEEREAALQVMESTAGFMREKSRSMAIGVVLTALGAMGLYFTLHNEEQIANLNRRRERSDTAVQRIVWWVSTVGIVYGLFKVGHAGYELNAVANKLATLRR